MEYPQYIDQGGYRFYRNGSVLNIVHNRELKQKLIKGSHYVNLIDKMPGGGNKTRRVCVERMLFYLFTGDAPTRMYSIVNRNGQSGEYDITDLIKVRKCDKYLYSRGAYGGKKLDRQTCDKIRSEYNFNSKPKNQYEKEGASMRDLAKKYDVSKNIIQRILDGTYYRDETETPVQ